MAPSHARVFVRVSGNYRGCSSIYKLTAGLKDDRARLGGVRAERVQAGKGTVGKYRPTDIQIEIIFFAYHLSPLFMLCQEHIEDYTQAVKRKPKVGWELHFGNR